MGEEPDQQARVHESHSAPGCCHRASRAGAGHSAAASHGRRRIRREVLTDRKMSSILRESAAESLPQPYLLFPRRHHRAGLRVDGIRPARLGRRSLRGRMVVRRDGHHRLAAAASERGACPRCARIGNRCREHRRHHLRQLDSIADRSARVGTRHHQRHAHALERYAAVEGGRRASGPALDRHPHAAAEHSNRNRPQARGQTLAHGRYRFAHWSKKILRSH